MQTIYLDRTGKRAATLDRKDGVQLRRLSTGSSTPLTGSLYADCRINYDGTRIAVCGRRNEIDPVSGESVDTVCVQLHTVTDEGTTELLPALNVPDAAGHGHVFSMDESGGRFAVMTSDACLIYTYDATNGWATTAADIATEGRDVSHVSLSGDGTTLFIVYGPRIGHASADGECDVCILDQGANGHYTVAATQRTGILCLGISVNHDGTRFAVSYTEDTSPDSGSQTCVYERSKVTDTVSQVVQTVPTSKQASTVLSRDGTVVAIHQFVGNGADTTTVSTVYRVEDGILEDPLLEIPGPAFSVAFSGDGTVLGVHTVHGTVTTHPVTQTVQAAVAGDPYVFPVDGPPVKLPNAPCSYRMFQDRVTGAYADMTPPNNSFV